MWHESLAQRRGSMAGPLPLLLNPLDGLSPSSLVFSARALSFCACALVNWALALSSSFFTSPRLPLHGKWFSIQRSGSCSINRTYDSTAGSSGFRGRMPWMNAIRFLEGSPHLFASIRVFLPPKSRKLTSSHRSTSSARV